MTGGAIVLSLAGCLVTYRGWVDGPLASFLASLALAAIAGAAALVWLLVHRVPWPALALIPVLAASPAPVVHGVRLLNRHAAVGASLDQPLGFLRLLEPTLRGDASVIASLEEVILRAPAGSVGYLGVRSATAVPTVPAAHWYLPRALYAAGGAHVVDECKATARVELDNTYMVLLDTGAFLVQVTSWGAAVTVKDAGGVRVDDLDVPDAPKGWHQWTLRRAGGQARLLVDGREAWTAPDLGEWPYVRLGETRTDPEHGGTLRLRQLTLRRAAA